MSDRYETCPWCSKHSAVRKDGTFWHHNGNEWEPGGIFRKLCPGVGRDAPTATPALPARATQHNEETK